MGLIYTANTWPIQKSTYWKSWWVLITRESRNIKQKIDHESFAPKQYAISKCSSVVLHIDVGRA